MAVCPLTGQEINLQVSPNPMYYHYKTPKTGEVHFTDVAFPAASGLSEDEKCILTGICRNRTINGEQPLMIDMKMLSQLKDQHIPYGFEARARHLLQHLYNHGGKEYQTHNLNSSIDGPITYSSQDEFIRILRYLKSEGLIDHAKVIPTNAGTFYQKVSMTKEGIKEIERGLSKQPMIGLVNEDIKIGDENIDIQVKHARKLFFDEHSTMESKRSACETLSFVLEPLREELKTSFRGDTEAFFNIVNNFSIRHNKAITKSIENEEQLEWVFYSLLNTINTYSKMKRKLI
jgi:hypothetical protein